jgi:uncharacterized protein HemY
LAGSFADGLLVLEQPVRATLNTRPSVTTTVNSLFFLILIALLLFWFTYGISGIGIRSYRFFFTFRNEVKTKS